MNFVAVRKSPEKRGAYAIVGYAVTFRFFIRFMVPNHYLYKSSNEGYTCYKQLLHLALGIFKRTSFRTAIDTPFCNLLNVGVL